MNRDVCEHFNPVDLPCEKCNVQKHRREWRGLNDTERASLQHEAFERGLSPLEFMELHEAKLKELNHELHQNTHSM